MDFVLLTLKQKSKIVIKTGMPPRLKDTKGSQRESLLGKELELPILQDEFRGLCLPAAAAMSLHFKFSFG
jgi:hypothetical protein